jgi:hypothetical protein
LQKTLTPRASPLSSPPPLISELHHCPRHRRRSLAANPRLLPLYGQEEVAKKVEGGLGG